MLIIFIGSLSLTALIPRQALQSTSAASADYYMKHELFFDLIADKEWTQIDYYADAILLNIAYNLDSQQPLSSSLEAAYYSQKYVNVNASYKETVSHSKAANTSYARYWHGSLVFLRPLLLFLSARQIYSFNAIVLCLLLLAVEGALLRRGHYLLGVSFFIAAGVTGSFMIPFSIEYTTTFILMLTFSLMIVLLEKWDRHKWLPFFFGIGMLTNFVDFLTTETITLTVPLVLILCLQKEKDAIKNFKEGFIFSLNSILCWGIAYSFTWFSKWLISSLVLQRNVFYEAFHSVEERTIGQVSAAPLWQPILGVIKNIALLFPMHYSATYNGVVLLLIGTAFVFSCIIYLYRRKMNDLWFVKLLLIICLIPYIRYLVLGNHSYLHYFFTYRAQFPVVISLIYLTWWSLDKKLLRKEFLRYK